MNIELFRLSIYSWVNVRCCYFSRTKSSSWRLPNLYVLICSQNLLLYSVGFVVISPFSFLKLGTSVFLPYLFVSLAREYSSFTFLQVIQMIWISTCLLWAMVPKSAQFVKFQICKKLFIISFSLAALGLGCCARASRRVGLSCYRAWVQAQWLWPKGLVTLRQMGSSQTRDRIHVICTGGWILYHCTTGKVPSWVFNAFAVLFGSVPRVCHPGVTWGPLVVCYLIAQLARLGIYCVGSNLYT